MNCGHVPGVCIKMSDLLASPILLLTESFETRFNRTCLELKIWGMKFSLVLNYRNRVDFLAGMFDSSVETDMHSDLALEIMRRNFLLAEYHDALREYWEEKYSDLQADCVNDWDIDDCYEGADY